VTDERQDFINRVMTHRYGIHYDPQGMPMIAPQERWDYGEKRKGVTADLMRMSAQQLVYLRLDMEMAVAVAEANARAESYDPWGFANR
jgi:hypothetical protein